MDNPTTSTTTETSTQAALPAQLPTPAPTPSPAPAPAQAPVQPTTNAATSPATSVLYVEDDAQSRRLMQMLITGRMKLPHLTVFEDSQNFVAAVEALDPKPSIIFLDIHMKPITGFEMLKLLRAMEWTKDVPIIALTASVMNEEVQQLRTSGFNGCLAKPLDLATFPDTFKRILQGETIWRIID